MKKVLSGMIAAVMTISQPLLHMNMHLISWAKL